MSRRHGPEGAEGSTIRGRGGERCKPNLGAGRGARAYPVCAKRWNSRRKAVATGPGLPSPMARPSMRTTGITIWVAEVTKASRAAPSRSRDTQTRFNISGPGGGHSSITTQPSIRTDDPYFSYLSILDSGSQVTSASGGYNGKTGTSHTNDYDGGESAVYNGWDKTIGLSANQSIVAGVTVDFNSSQTTFQNTGLAPGFAAGPATVGSTSQTTYGVTGSLDYFVGTAYFGTNLAGYWGNGRLTETFAGGASGSYGVHGDAVSFIAGNVFTLFDSRPAASRTALPGKAPPKPASGGYAIQLDVRGFVGHVEDTADGFTDTGGFTWGAERVAFWDAGAQARLFATIPDGRLTWDALCRGKRRTIILLPGRA